MYLIELIELSGVADAQTWKNCVAEPQIELSGLIELTDLRHSTAVQIQANSNK